MTEHDEQVVFVNYLIRQGIKHTAIVNSFFGKPSPRKFGMINKFKKEGWNVGVPDMLLLVPINGHMEVVFIEMKQTKLKPKRSGKGGVSDVQRAWIDAINDCKGSSAYVCYGANEAIGLVEGLMS